MPLAALRTLLAAPPDLPAAAGLAELVARVGETPAVLQSPPGSGKTTLVPPALAVALEGRVVVAQPRRIAARAAASRLAELLSEPVDATSDYAVRGERRYTSMILQNLLDNARKYNRPNGRIQVGAHREGDQVVLVVGNTGATIPAEAQERIFDRFHRGGMGENVPGHGLGLNLARELARLHGGELKLTRSEADWTEFEVHFAAAAASSSQ